MMRYTRNNQNVILVYMGDQGVLRSRVDSFAQCDLYEPVAHVLADVLGLDEPDVKSLILGRQTWKMYKSMSLFDEPQIFLSDSLLLISYLRVRTKVRKGWCDMNKMKMCLVVGMAVVGAAVCRADTKTTYRDASGRIQGTVTTDRNGKTTYRDYQGRIQRTETTDRYGKTTYRDASGRVTATETTDRYGKTTYRDSLGRIQGTKTTDRYGKTTYRDASGRIQGTVTTDRYGKTTYRDAQGRIQATKK